MIDISDIEDMDEEDVEAFVRGVETNEQLVDCVLFAQQLRAYAINERQARDSA